MDTKPVGELTYEQAYCELEGIIGLLEAGQSSLEESLSLYERGQALAQRCADLLNQAEVKVRTLSGETLPGEDEAA